MTLDEKHHLKIKIKLNEKVKKLFYHLETAMARRVTAPRPVKMPPMILPRDGTHLEGNQLC